MEYKLSQVDQLVAALKKKGLKVEKSIEPEGEFVDIWDGDSKMGHFEPGNESFELICYSWEAEQLAKKHGLMNLTKYYWPWY
jgi:hypothetical protein